MKVSEILAGSKKAFPSLEIVPPLRGLTKDELLESIEPFMEFSPRYINVTSHRDEFEYRQEADGSFTRHLIRNRISETTVCAAIMSRYEVEVVPHLICGGSTAEEIESKLDNLAFLGINNIVALRGDCISGEKRFSPTPGGYRYASELVEGIRSYQGSSTYRRSRGLEADDRFFCIGVGAYPEKHFEAPNLETDIANLKKKVDAGADYIKTSTGKLEPAATPEAAFVMCQAIKEYYDETGIQIGFKPAGGMKTVGDALSYYTIVKEVLGEKWLNNTMLRLGTSSLANKLLTDILGTETKFF